VAGLLALGARCVHLQIFKARSLTDRARSQQEKVIALDPYRGPIVDRNGEELALSLAVDSVYADPSEITAPAKAARGLARIVGVKASTLKTRLQDGERQFVWIKRKITPDQRHRIERLGFAGIGFVRESRRYYPKRALASHVLGACGVDNEGLAGLEFAFEQAIRGTPGRMLFLRDGRGGKVLDRARTEPIPGLGLELTLDVVIQHIAERELTAAMKTSKARGGAVVVLQPRTGEILALASHPTFDPNRYSSTSESERRNRAVTDLYEPGSTFKPITAAAVLDHGRVRPNETIWCENGSIVVARHRFREDSRPFGSLTFTEVLARSSNVGAIKIARRLEPSEFFEAVRRFGFGRKTGIELPGESVGLLREVEDWSGLSHASIAIGQEVGVTPLQLASAIGAIANDGVRLPPRVVRRKIGPRGRRLLSSSIEAAKAQRAISASTAQSLRHVMQSITGEKATGRRAGVPGYSIGGKTGTAQKIDASGRYNRSKHVAWFAGFAPAAQPAIVIVVMLDEPRGPRFHGGDVAAPVFSRIARPVLQYLNVPPDRDATLVFDRSPSPTLQTKSAAARGGAHLETGLSAAPAHRAEGQRGGGRPGGDGVMKLSFAGLPELAAPGDCGGPAASTSSCAAQAGESAGGVMPDLTGMSLRRASEALASVGLVCRSIRPGGRVRRQKPAAGLPIVPGDPCAITY
jgi:cell division protein FtsI (penicillin-binding protein 3)